MIPERYRSKCDLCGKEVDIREDGIHQWTAGWVKQRVGGGGHGISLPERSNKWAHGYCVDMETRGLLSQKSMF